MVTCNYKWWLKGLLGNNKRIICGRVATHTDYNGNPLCHKHYNKRIAKHNKGILNQNKNNIAYANKNKAV